MSVTVSAGGRGIALRHVTQRGYIRGLIKGRSDADRFKRGKS